MANRTDPEAKTIHGTNPQNMVEKILRMKIYDSTYWKEHCFALTAEAVVDKAVDIKSLGGTYGGARKPSKFVCLLLKLLQLQPDKDIIIEFIKNEDYKYVRVLGAFYMRLVGRPIEVYNYLEPLYNDYRKLRMQNQDGGYALSHVDEVIDQMLTQEYLFDIALPRLPHRLTLERLNQLEPWISAMADDFDEAAIKAEEDAAKKQADALLAEVSKERRHTDRLRLKDHNETRDRRRRSHSRERDRAHDDGHERDKHREREKERRSGRDHEKKRRRSTSRERPGRDGVKSRKADQSDPAIILANQERAKLGLRPLK
ncbi:U4/U6-U5 snRNP complex subunit prp38 [Trebouxia sp. C0010 RCD-2024]